MFRKFLAILIIITILLMGLGAYGANPVTVYWNQVGGGDVYWLYHASITGDQAKTGGVHFNALSSFNELILGFSLNGTNTASLYLYKWTVNYEESLQTEPVWAKQDYTFANGVNKIDLGSELVKGEYLFVITDVVSHGEGDYLAMWSQATKTPNAEYYTQGQITDTANDFISGGISYVDDTYNSLGEITAAKIPKELAWGQIGGGDAYFLHHESITGGKIQDIGVRFNALNDFIGFKIGVNGGKLKLKFSLYSWKGNYEKTIKSSPVWEDYERESSITSVKAIKFGRLIEKGEYLFLISLVEGQDYANEEKAVWTFEESGLAECYASGEITHDNLETMAGAILYADSSVESFGHLSTIVENPKTFDASLMCLVGVMALAFKKKKEN